MQIDTEYLDVLDAEGNPTGIARTKEDVHRDGDWHRVVHAWIQNSKGELLLQHRSPDKLNYPDMWDISAAGHISSENTSLETVLHEAEEEIGITIPSSLPQLLFSVRSSVVLNEGTYLDNEFQDIYLIRMDVADSDVVFTDGEADAVKWISPKNLLTWARTDPPDLVPHTEEYEKLCAYLEKNPIVNSHI